MKFVCTKILLSLLTLSGNLEYGEGKRDRLDGRDGLNVQIEVPKFVKAGDTAVLKCIYDLGGDSLYTMKWYKGNHEFFRFTPKESPPIKTFPVPGLQIDHSQSNATHLTLKRVDLNLTARYSCEVTTDFPDFTTDVKTANLYVVAYPERRPEIGLPKKYYAVGDLVEANCTSGRSKPAANLTWLINGHLANPSYLNSPVEQRFRDSDNKESSHIGIRFIVRQSHFVSGRLKLSCLAKIQNLYHQTSEETIQEDNRPKISSVVDNSSSTGSSSSNSRFKNTETSGSSSMDLSSPGRLLFSFFIITVLLQSFSYILVQEDSSKRAGKSSSAASVGALMRQSHKGGSMSMGLNRHIIDQQWFSQT